MPATSSERQLAASIAAHDSWARTADRTARTAPARAALEAKFLAEAGGDPLRAEHLRKAYYKRIALKSVRARRKASEAAREAAEVAAEFAALDRGGAVA